MPFDASVIQDSVSPEGIRLTTVAATYPRIVHAEMMTHRVFSRNGQSTRGIPSLTLIERVEADLYVPVYWGRNTKGMQAWEELPPDKAKAARKTWLRLARVNLAGARRLAKIGLHKQWANRPIEPFSYYTLLISSTDWANFFALRTDRRAQGEIRLIADMILEARRQSEPKEIGYGRWHLPFIRGEDIDKLQTFGGHSSLKQVSAARCARTSYLNHYGIANYADDLRLFNDLVGDDPPHMSPLEHQATPAFPGDCNSDGYVGNFRGWIQHRKEYPNEVVRD